MAGSKAKGRKSKLGKNKHRIAVYYSSGRYEWNKGRRLVKHIRRYHDAAAVTALKTILAAMPLRLQREFEATYPIGG